MSRQIDWASVHKRMEAALRRTEEAVLPPPRRAVRILKERARALAAPEARSESDGDTIQLVAFAPRGKPHFIESRFVREVVQASATTPVPRAPDFLVGIINVRGELLPVFDLLAFLGLADASPQPHARLMVVGEQRAEFVIAADWVEPATVIARASIRAAPEDGDQGPKSLLGLTAEGIPIIDGAVLIAEPGLHFRS